MSLRPVDWKMTRYCFINTSEFLWTLHIMCIVISYRIRFDRNRFKEKKCSSVWDRPSTELVQKEGEKNIRKALNWRFRFLSEGLDRFLEHHVLELHSTSKRNESSNVYYSGQLPTESVNKQMHSPKNEQSGTLQNELFFSRPEGRSFLDRRKPLWRWNYQESSGGHGETQSKCSFSLIYKFTLIVRHICWKTSMAYNDV